MTTLHWDDEADATGLVEVDVQAVLPGDFLNEARRVVTVAWRSDKQVELTCENGDLLTCLWDDRVRVMRPKSANAFWGAWCNRTPNEGMLLEEGCWS